MYNLGRTPIVAAGVVGLKKAKQMVVSLADRDFRRGRGGRSVGLFYPTMASEAFRFSMPRCKG